MEMSEVLGCPYEVKHCIVGNIWGLCDVSYSGTFGSHAALVPRHAGWNKLKIRQLFLPLSAEAKASRPPLPLHPPMAPTFLRQIFSC